MPRLRCPPPRFPVLLVVVVTVSLGLHHYVFHSPAPQTMLRHAAVPEMFSPAQRIAADGASASAKLRSASDDTPPRVKPLLSSNIIRNNTVIEHSDHEGSVLTSSSTTTRRKHFSTSKTPLCALNSTVDICEEDNEYDEEIAHAIRVALKNSLVGAFLQDPVVSGLLQDPIFTKEDAHPSSRLAPRLGPGVDFAPACRSKQDTIVPTRAHNKNGTWFHVINQDNIRQVFVYESCLWSNADCQLGVPTPPTVETTCQQRFIYRKMLVLHDAGKEVMEEAMLIPSCCVCFISRADKTESGL